MNKNRLSIQRETSYFLGINQENERVYLRLPSFNCGWYWGAGYISTYGGVKNTDNNFSMHTHFKGYIIGQQEKYDFEKKAFIKTKYTYHLNEVLKESVLNEKESWVLSELINSMDILKKSSGFYYSGSSGSTQNPLKIEFQREEEYKLINSVLLPKVFVEIDKLLKEKNQEGLTFEFFQEQFKPTQKGEF